MNVPYTTSTGIKIGSRYMENGRVSPLDDPDMQRIQLALLATPNYLKTKRRYELTIALSAMTLVLTFVGAYWFS